MAFLAALGGGAGAGAGAAGAAGAGAGAAGAATAATAAGAAAPALASSGLGAGTLAGSSLMPTLGGAAKAAGSGLLGAGKSLLGSGGGPGAGGMGPIAPSTGATGFGQGFLRGFTSDLVNMGGEGPAVDFGQMAGRLLQKEAFGGGSGGGTRIDDIAALVNMLNGRGQRNPTGMRRQMFRMQ